MNIKTKLRLAFGVLFIIVFTFGGVSLYYMNKIAESSKNILKDNYESLNYSRKMREILDENTLPLSKAAGDQFNVELDKERRNITEKGEGEAVSALSEAYNVIIDSGTSMSMKQEALNKARVQIRNIEELNMDAVIRKNTTAQEGVQQAATYLMLAASLCFLLLFSFIVNLPELIDKSRKTNE